MNNLLNKLQEANQFSCKIKALSPEIFKVQNQLSEVINTFRNSNTSKLLDNFNRVGTVGKLFNQNNLPVINSRLLDSLNTISAVSKLLNQRLSVFDTNSRFFEKLTTINDNFPKVTIKNYKDII